MKNRKKTESVPADGLRSLKSEQKKKKRRNVLLWILIVLLVLAVLGIIACDERLVIDNYVVESDKINSEFRIAHITDLHNELYGENQSMIMDALEKINPDIVVFTGDIADPLCGDENAYLLARLVAEKYRSYYVFGNHENSYVGSVQKICDKFAACGLIVLRGDGEFIQVRDETVLVCGVDDPLASPDYNLRMWEDELDDCNEMIKDGVFSVLLTHRPECVSDYSATGFDLILAGHAHGGQVRIPFIVPQGLYAPIQHWFPKYTGGIFTLDGGNTMIVSRGLSKYIRPRVFNRPEVVGISVKPISDEK